MYIRGLIPRNFAELAEAVLIASGCAFFDQMSKCIDQEHMYFKKLSPMNSPVNTSVCAG